MGICTQQYRFTIGIFNAKSVCVSVRKCVNCQQPSLLSLFSTFGYFLYSVVIFVLLLSSSILLLADSHAENGTLYKCCCSLAFPNFIALPILLFNQLFLRLIIDAYMQICPIFLDRKVSLKYIFKCFSKGKITQGLCYLYTIGAIFLNILLVVISNMSLLNPGPSCPNLSVFYQNVQGLVNPRTLDHAHPSLNITKVLELQSYIDKHKFDLIILNETWLKSSIHDAEIIPFPHYNIFRLDRNLKTHPPDINNPNKFKRNGGGVLIAVNSELGLNPTIVKSPCNAELLSVKLSLPNNKQFCISTCYRVGTLGDYNFSQISNRLHYIVNSKKINGHLLIGDLNLESVDWPSYRSSVSLHKKFLDLFADIGHSQLIANTTHYLGKILDLCITSAPHMLTNLRVLEFNEAVKSDHFGIVFDLKYKYRKLKTPPYTIFNFSKANWDALNYELSRVPWDTVLKFCDIHTAWPKFKAIFNSLCVKHIPKIKVKSKMTPPWFDSDVHKLCLKKERFRKLFRSTGNEMYNTKFKNCRKEIKKTIKVKMRSNFDDDSNPKVVTKKFWSYVKSCSNSSRIPDTISFGGRFRSDLTDKANLFNDYFCQQFSSPSSYDIDIDFNYDPLLDFAIDFRTVRKILSSINENKSQGPDGINGKILKNCASSIAYPVTLLFNLSFSQGQIPSEWKLANIVPIHKKGDKTKVENYRPISLTSLIMKIFEKCIRDELLNLCKHLIHPSQHGFLPNKSCTTQLIPFIDSLACCLNNRNKIDVVYFDFAKAFDSVSHDIILDKLKHDFKIDGLLLKFIKDYLQGRKQRVVLGSGISNEADVISGVPQGSILGPLLFVLFINDLHTVVSEGTSIALYADDTKIWREILSEYDCITLNSDIQAMTDWAMRNLMTFHPKKCKILSVAHNVFLDFLPFQTIFPYVMNNTLLDHVTSENDLGLLVHQKLNWSIQQASIISKALCQFNLLRRTCHFVKNQHKKRTLYLTIIRSLFEHCSPIWCPTLEAITNKFEPFQKRCIKWILNEQSLSYSQLDYFKKLYDLKIMPLSYKFTFSDLVLFYKICNDLVPIILPDYVIKRTNTRSSDNGILFGLDTQYATSSKSVFTHSFFPRCISHWNTLPIDIRKAANYNEFHSKLVNHIWNSVAAYINEIDPEPD